MENIIFGIRPVAEAIESHKQIERIYIRKGAEGQLMTDLKDLCMRHRLRWQEVPVEKLNRLTRGNHQGVVAQTAAIEYVELNDILERVPEDETRRHSPLGRVRRRPRPHSSAQKLSTGQCRCDQGVGRCSEQDTGMPRGVDPQHA